MVNLGAAFRQILKTADVKTYGSAIFRRCASILAPASGAHHDPARDVACRVVEPKWCGVEEAEEDYVRWVYPTRQFVLAETIDESIRIRQDPAGRGELAPFVLPPTATVRRVYRINLIHFRSRSIRRQLLIGVTVAYTATDARWASTLAPLKPSHLNRGLDSLNNRIRFAGFLPSQQVADNTRGYWLCEWE